MLGLLDYVSIGPSHSSLRGPLRGIRPLTIGSPYWFQNFFVVILINVVKILILGGAGDGWKLFMLSQWRALSYKRLSSRIDHGLLHRLCGWKRPQALRCLHGLLTNEAYLRVWYSLDDSGLFLIWIFHLSLIICAPTLANVYLPHGDDAWDLAANLMIIFIEIDERVLWRFLLYN